MICVMSGSQPYTARNLHQRMAEHKNSPISRRFLEAHGSNNVLKESQFTILGKCQKKFDRRRRF